MAYISGRPIKSHVGIQDTEIRGGWILSVHMYMFICTHIWDLLVPTNPATAVCCACSPHLCSLSPKQKIAEGIKKLIWGMASYLAQCPDELRTAILFSSFLGNQKNSVPVLYPLLSLPQILPVGMSEESYLGAVAERVQCPLSCIYGRGYLLMVTAETRNMLYLLMQLSM